MNNETPTPKEFIEGDIVGMMHYIFRKMNEISSRLDRLEERTTVRMCRTGGEYTYAASPVYTNLGDMGDIGNLSYGTRDGTYTINTNI